MIDRYLTDLGRRLPVLGRGRVVAETEDHLGESAREYGEQEAIARFGPLARVAREFRRTLCPERRRGSSPCRPARS